MSQASKLLLILFVFLVCAAASLLAWQGSPTFWLYGWNGGIAWVRLGPTLTVSNGQIDVSLPPTVTRRRDVMLAYDAAVGGWKVPAGAVNLIPYLAGMRIPPSSYKISGGVLTPALSGFWPQADLMVDYDEPAK